MSSKTAIPIKPIDFDIAKRVVEDFAAERNVPRQVFPHAEPGRGGEGAAPRPVPRPSAPPPSPSSKFTVVLPDYVIEAIHARALQSRPKRTARAVVLEALKAVGIEVRDADMVLDGRRGRGPGEL